MAAMAACSCYDTSSTVAACSREAADATTVAKVAAKSNEATPVVSGFVGSGVTMAEVGLGPGSGSTPRADGSACSRWARPRAWSRWVGQCRCSYWARCHLIATGPEEA
jgi:hypothetical protein